MSIYIIHIIGCDFSTLSAPENGNFAITTTGGEVVASYTCEIGYQLVGNAVLTCQSDGQFSGEEPVCYGEYWTVFS